LEAIRKWACLRCLEPGLKKSENTHLKIFKEGEVILFFAGNLLKVLRTKNKLA